MNKTVFCLVACVFLAAAATANRFLRCYQCFPVTEECVDKEAIVVICGGTPMSKCIRQVKKDATDKTKAFRKCVSVDYTGNVICPNGYDCVHCEENLCNANPVVLATTVASGSAPFVKSAWSAVVAVTVASFYL